MEDRAVNPEALRVVEEMKCEMADCRCGNISHETVQAWGKRIEAALSAPCDPLPAEPKRWWHRGMNTWIEAPAEPMDSGAVEQLQRIAKMLGYERAWAAPTEPERWFLERNADSARIQVVLLDAAIAPMGDRAVTTLDPEPGTLRRRLKIIEETFPRRALYDDEIEAIRMAVATLPTKPTPAEPERCHCGRELKYIVGADPLGVRVLACMGCGYPPEPHPRGRTRCGCDPLPTPAEPMERFTKAERNALEDAINACETMRGWTSEQRRSEIYDKAAIKLRAMLESSPAVEGP